MLTRAALALGATAGLLLLLEVPAYLGSIDWGLVVGPSHARRFTHMKPWDNPVNVRDPELLFRHKPLLRFRGETVGDLVDLYGIATTRRYEADVAYDENGFRNPPELKQADLVLIGDSFLEAGLVPMEELLSTRLAATLGTRAANLGHSGYGPQQELVVLNRYGLPLRPKTVVWLFFEGNDLIDTGRYEQARSGQGDLDPQKTRFRQRSLLANLSGRLGDLLRSVRREDAPEAERRCGTFESKDGPVKLYFAFAGEPLSPEDVQHLLRAEKVLADAAAECEGAGVRYLIAFVPTKFRVYEGIAKFGPDTLCRAWWPSDLPAALASFCKTEKIDFLDLTGGLRSAAQAGELVYFQDDGHWNPKGHEVVARMLAERLRP